MVNGAYTISLFTNSGAEKSDCLRELTLHGTRSIYHKALTAVKKGAQNELNTRLFYEIVLKHPETLLIT